MNLDVKIVLGALIGFFLVFLVGSAIMPSIETARGSFVDSNCDKTLVNSSYGDKANETYILACALGTDGVCRWSGNLTKSVAACTNAVQQTASEKLFSHTTVMLLVSVMFILGIIGLIWHYKGQGHN